MNYTHLIIVPCHGIWKGDIPDNGFSIGNTSSGDDHNQWLLAPFQLEGKDHLCFKDHILKGFQLLTTDPNSILMPSGGQTKADIQLSESQSYLNLLNLVMGSATDSYKSRIILENYARDSFENVIYLICRFYEVTGCYPQNITIIGFEFKRSRFLKYHLEQALNYPLDLVEYIGNCPTPPQEIHQAYFKELDNSEYQFAVKLFQQDWYGIKDPLLKKRVGRNPFNQKNNYGTTNPTLEGFIKAITDGSKLTNEEVKEIVRKSAPWSRLQNSHN